MNKISTGVFQKYGEDTLSPRVFYASLSLSLLWGLVVTAIIAYQIALSGYMPSWIEMLIIGLIVPLIGVYISVKSDIPFVSFIGYNMIIIPFSVILGPVLNQYSHNIVMNAFGATAVVTFIMGGAGTLFPSLFARLGPVLFIALLGLLLIRVAQLFIPALNLSIFDYLGAGIFSLYIGYDMYRANNIQKTLDNAIDVAINLYLDIINLFITLLRLYSNK